MGIDKQNTGAIIVILVREVNKAALHIGLGASANAPSQSHMNQVAQSAFRNDERHRMEVFKDVVL